MTHQLTDEQRKLLEDCPREKLEVALAANMPTIEIWEDGGGEVCACTSRARRSIGIPSAAVEAWLAEQEAQDAEIERRIGALCLNYNKLTDRDIMTETCEVYYMDERGYLWRKPGEGRIETNALRIRAALDRHRAEQADHFRDATKMVPPQPANHIADASKMVPEADQSGDGTEMIRYPDEVGEDEGPWLVEKDSVKWSTGRYDEAGNYWDACVFYYYDSTPYPQSTKAPYSEPEARCLAEAERDRLNAIWRTEEQARRREAAHAEALEEDRRRVVTISPELRARLEEGYSRAVAHVARSVTTWLTFDTKCSIEQARAFLRERGIEVPND